MMYKNDNRKLDAIILNRNKPTYLRVVKVMPTERHYEEAGEKPYIKYGCPVCDAAGFRHSVQLLENSCPCCGVRLCWDKGEEDE